MCAMTADKVLAELLPIFQDVFDDDVVPVPRMTASDVDGWDSLGHIRLVVAVESHFGIRFTSAEIGSWPDVGAFVDAISAKLS
jgi:acyl carrier protein